MPARSVTIHALLLIAVALAACGPSPEASATQTAGAATAIALAWTATPSPTATATATATPTPSITPTPTATDTPGPTPLPEVPLVLPDGVTGEAFDRCPEIVDVRQLLDAEIKAYGEGRILVPGRELPYFDLLDFGNGMQTLFIHSSDNLVPVSCGVMHYHEDWIFIMGLAMPPAPGMERPIFWHFYVGGWIYREGSPWLNQQSARVEDLMSLTPSMIHMARSKYMWLTENGERLTTISEYLLDEYSWMRPLEEHLSDPNALRQLEMGIFVMEGVSEGR